MIFQRREKRDGYNFYTSNVKIDIVQSYSYLETQISSTGNFTLSLEHLRERLSVHARIDFSRLNPSLAPKTFETFDTMISLILTYNWTKPGVSLSNQSSSIGTLHRIKKVTYSFVDNILTLRWIVPVFRFFEYANFERKEQKVNSTS